MPRAANRAAVVDLPIPTDPVRPSTITSRHLFGQGSCLASDVRLDQRAQFRRHLRRDPEPASEARRRLMQQHPEAADGAKTAGRGIAQKGSLSWHVDDVVDHGMRRQRREVDIERWLTLQTGRRRVDQEIGAARCPPAGRRAPEEYRRGVASAPRPARTYGWRPALRRSLSSPARRRPPVPLRRRRSPRPVRAARPQPGASWSSAPRKPEPSVDSPQSSPPVRPQRVGRAEALGGGCQPVTHRGRRLLVRDRYVAADEPTPADLIKEPGEIGRLHGDLIVRSADGVTSEPVAVDQRRTRVRDRPADHRGMAQPDHTSTAPMPRSMRNRWSIGRPRIVDCSPSMVSKR